MRFRILKGEYLVFFLKRAPVEKPNAPSVALYETATTATIVPAAATTSVGAATTTVDNE